VNGTEIAVSPARVVQFLLVMARVGGVMLAAPIFGHPGVPARVRVVVIVTTAFGLAGLVPVGAAAATADVPSLAGRLLLELGTGLMVGLAVELVLTGVLMGGELAGIHMGLGIAQVVDPRTQLNATPVALWIHFVALQVFLVLDGHHLLMRALMRSFEIVPPGGLSVSAAGLGAFLGAVGGMFEVAVRIASPIVGGLLIADTGLGLLSRAIPQLNVFIMGFAIKIVVGFLMLSAAVPFIVRFVAERLAQLDRLLIGLLGGLG
jgi:flagellar biosynthetic protein FliR